VADELKLAGANLNILLVDDIKPFKQRKVGILNGGHTALVPVALLAGLTEVGQAVEDPQVGAWLRAAIDEEIIPALPMERAGLEAFAKDVILRFRNPAINHKLASIALNSWSKFAARIMPQLARFSELHGGVLPQRLVTALAATMLLYRGGVVTLADDPATLDWFAHAWEAVQAGQMTQTELVRGWLACERVWGRDLNQVAGLADAVTSALALIDSDGMRAAM
jgi:tagaturonate reductase